MNSYTIFAEIAPGQTRVGFFDSTGIIQEVWLCRDDQPDLTGSVHQARIEQVFAGQNRARARLADGTLISIKLPKVGRDAIVAGALVVVTIIAPPRHNKPWQAVLDARVVTIPFVLLPGQTGINLSRSFDSKAAADLRDTMAELEVPDGFGLLLRRHSRHMSCAMLQVAVADLVADWQSGYVACDPAMPGVLYDGGSIRQRALRSVPDGSYHTCCIGDAMSEQIDEAVATAMRTQLHLPSGGKLWCQRTHALWAIDIDGADANIEKHGFNGLLDESACVIARQIRLRGMSGPIMIDVPCAGLTRKKFQAQLQSYFAHDPQNPRILGVTRGGMLELWRPHGRVTLDDSMTDKVAQATLAGLRMVGARQAFKPIQLAVNTAMAEWLGGVGKTAVASLGRPLELNICLDDDPRAEAYIIDSAPCN